jgi:hypothetical protein
LVSRPRPTLDRWKLSGVSDWRLAEPRADLLCCPLELLGRREVTTTMIYTRVLNRGPAAVRSPADRMFGP